jgi:hypothetical protein
MYAMSLPNPPKPSYDQRVTLDGVDYILRMRWNQRGGWYCGLRDASSGEDIFSPQHISVDWDMLYGCTHERRPPGVLLATDTSGQKIAPGYRDMDQRVKLVYIPVDEIAGLVA